jgi:hypothetical protein
MAQLKNIKDTCTPRADVLGGRLVDKHFAAQLDQVIRQAEGYESYSDAASFFDLTYPTAGLKELLAGTFARLSGQPEKAASAEHSVYRYETSFGGGKTHGLIALWHLAKGARPANVDEFIDPSLLPANCQVAALVGDSLDPSNGLTTDGVTTYTMWGEIARQLGPEAWEKMALSDENRESPGKQTWLEIFGDTPTVIVIDEIAQYLRQLVTSGSGETQKLAKATIHMLKVLFEAATSAPAVRVIVTLATGTKAFGAETTEIEAQLFDVAAQGLIDEANDVMGRPKGAIGRPAKDEEIGYILRRRLFESVDESAAKKAAKTYKALYQDLADQGIQIGQATANPAAYSELIESAYPFHPALIDCLDKRIGPLPGFQRARGALKMLAETVAYLWANENNVPTINLGDLPLEADQVLASVTSSIHREELSGPATADFAADTSHAWSVDDARWAEERTATRSCRSVFLHSIVGEPSPGASLPDIYIGTLRPGENPDVIDQALQETSQVAWHLVYDGASWRFQVEPNANRIIAAEQANITNAQISEELDRRIRRIFPNDAQISAIHAATSPAEVPDADKLRLIVFSYEDLTTVARDAGKAPDKVVDIASYAGLGGQNRVYRNSVVSLVADGDGIDSMKAKIRFELASQRVTADRERMSQFDRNVALALKEIADKAELETRVAICAAYRHLYWPTKDAKNNNLRHHQLPPRNQGEIKNAQTQVVVDALIANGKISTTMPPTDRLASTSGFSRSGEATTSQVAEVPWKDHAAKIVLAPNLITDAISAGIRNGTWVYYDAAAERAFTHETPPPAVRIGGDTWLYSKEKAEELNLLRKPISLSLIIESIGSTGLIEGAALRETLEEAIGGEPTKKDVLGVLATGAQTGEHIVVVKSPAGKDSKPLTVPGISNARLDDLQILSRDAAKNLGIGVDESKKELVASGEGSVGSTFQRVADKVADLGADLVTSVSVTATADPGEGPRDLRLLGFCIPQLPRFDCQINVRVIVEFPGLSDGLKVDLSGTSSDYQRIEEALLKLADLGSNVSGSLTLKLTPSAPIKHNDGDWMQLKDVVTNNDPGNITLTADLSKET